MKSILLGAIAPLLFTLNAIAVERTFKTTDGKTYEKAEVTRVEPDGIRISYTDGLAKIPFTNLPKEVQSEFGYNAAKVDDYNKAADLAAAEKKAFDDEVARNLAAMPKTSQPAVAAKPAVALSNSRAGAPAANSSGLATSTGLNAKPTGSSSQKSSGLGTSKLGGKGK